MTRRLRIGVDLGGSKIEAAVIDAAGAVLLRRRLPTPAGDYDATLDTIAALVAGIERQIGASATVGIGMPGAISPASGLVKNANSVCLNGRPLRADLEARLGRPLRFANDANCFALSEATDGAAASRRIVFGAILGTGVGGGIVIDRRLLIGAAAIAGEWGHNPLPWPQPAERPGPACWCGQTGCIETFLSGPGIAADYRRETGCEGDAVQISAAAAAGEPAARATLDRYIDRLARALAAVINLIDPNAIVLGGGLSAIGELYGEVPRRWRRYVFSDRVATRLLPPVHGDSSGVRGAAWLWPPAAET